MGFFSEGAVDLGLIKLLGPCPRSVLRVRFSLYGKCEGFVGIGAGLNVFLSIAGPFGGSQTRAALVSELFKGIAT